MNNPNDPTNKTAITTFVLVATATGCSQQVTSFRLFPGKHNAAKPRSMTPLMAAAIMGNPDVVKILLGNVMDIDARDKDGQTVLMLAAMEGKLDIVKLLVANGANVNERADDGGTPLILAAYSGYLDVVKFLIAKGADVNAIDKNYTTPLGHAVGGSSINVEVVKALVSKGADVNTRPEGDMPLLVFPVMWGRLDVVKILVDAGADVNAKSKDGMTALRKATICSQPAVEAFLKEHGASQ